jgi:transcriptional regulator with XRE-family HTH domain
VRRDPAGPLERILARRLRDLAEQKGRPLYVLAELAGFSRPALWNILNQQASPTLNTVQRLATALGVPPLELLQGEPAPARPRASSKRRRAKRTRRTSR